MSWKIKFTDEKNLCISMHIVFTIDTEYFTIYYSYNVLSIRIGVSGAANNKKLRQAIKL